MSSTINAVIRYNLQQFDSSITRPANTDAYADGDVVANITTNDYFVFGDAGDPVVRINNPDRGGIVVGARLFSSQDNQTAKLDATLWVFNHPITEVADNAAFAPTDAEMLYCQGSIDFAIADWLAGTRTSGAGGNAFCPGSRGGSLEFELPFVASEAGLLYGVLQARNAYAPVSGEILTCYLDIVKL